MSEPSIFTRILHGRDPVRDHRRDRERVRDPRHRAQGAGAPAGDPEVARSTATSSSSPRAIPTCWPSSSASRTRVAAEHSDGDFRLVFNTGAGAGQTVFHVHAHVLAGDLDESEPRCLTRTTIPHVERVYADGVAMVQLLGPQDRLLRVVEREHPERRRARARQRDHPDRGCRSRRRCARRSSTSCSR